MKIGEFIQKYMDKKSISQAELARRSGVPASTLSSIINRNNDRIAIEMMLRICKVLECDIEEYVNSMRDTPPERVPELFAKKYNSLDLYGKDLVNTVLDMEYNRCESMKKPQESTSIEDVKMTTNNKVQEKLYPSKRIARKGGSPVVEMLTQAEIDEIKSRPRADEDM